MIGTSLRSVRTRRSRTLGAFAAAAFVLAALALPPVVAAALPTSTTISAAQTTVVAGDALSLTASVSPAPGAGSVSFTSSQFGSLGTAEVDPETEHRRDQRDAGTRHPLDHGDVPRRRATSRARRARP